jgi:hypothetical protein
VHDVQRALGLVRQVDDPAAGLRLADRRARQHVVARFGLAFRDEFLHQVIDHVAVLRVRGDDAAVYHQFLHQLEHLAVVDHQGALIRHEGLEGIDAVLVDHARRPYRTILL